MASHTSALARGATLDVLALRTELIRITSDLVQLTATLPTHPAGLRRPADTDQLARARRLLAHALDEVELLQLRVMVDAGAPAA